MTCLQFCLYVAAAVFELAGIGLSSYDIVRSHKVLKAYTDPNAPNQGEMAFGVHPLNKMALTELLSGRFRRMTSITLLGVGVLLGLAGNLAG